jgi:UDP-glucose 4-epimerase
VKILILGSQGFIGSHLVNYFVEKNYAVIGCDLVEFSTNRFAYNKVSILSSDFEKLFIENIFTLCINASGIGNVGYSLEHPLSDFESNTAAVAKVLDTIRKYQPTCKYMHISSAAVYGSPQKLPILETDILAPLSPYGFHKLMSEQLCKEYHQLYHLPIAIIRPFSVYGKGLKKQLIWDVCSKLSVSDKITLFGTGKESRDFLNVEDLALLIDIVAQKSPFNCNVYNAASGKETFIEEVVDIFKNYLGNRISINFSGKIKQGDPMNWCADISLIRHFGFETKTDFKDSVINYINWHQSLKV